MKGVLSKIKRTLPAARRNQRGQTLILAVLAMVMLVVAIIVLFDLQSTIRLKVKSQTAVDAATLAGAEWQRHSLNLIGELNLVKACTALVTTYTGLVIAIPGLCAYYVLGNRIKKIMEYVQGRLTMLFDEIDFDNIPADLVIVTKEARMAYLGGGKAQAGKVKTSPAAKSAVAVAAPAKVEHVACPNCSKEVTMGDKKCPHCNAELDWE